MFSTEAHGGRFSDLQFWGPGGGGGVATAHLPPVMFVSLLAPLFISMSIPLSMCMYGVAASRFACDAEGKNKYSQGNKQ